MLRECDLYHDWAPFVTKSKKLAQLDKLDVVGWFRVGVPMLGLTRDASYRAVGCDCMHEHGSVMLVAVGLNDENDGLNFEEVKGRSMHKSHGISHPESKLLVIHQHHLSCLGMRYSQRWRFRLSRKALGVVE